jgi:hypothetical protein
MPEDEKKNFEDLKEDRERDDKTEKPWWTELMREVALTGMATFFMTEDSVRSYLKELKLPKELGALLLDSVSRKKDDFYGLLAKEVGKMVSKIDVSAEVSRFLEKHKIHVEAKFSFEPKTGKDVNTEVTKDES